jgi:hypothetical protein
VVEQGRARCGDQPAGGDESGNNGKQLDEAFMITILSWTNVGVGRKIRAEILLSTDLSWT